MLWEYLFGTIGNTKQVKKMAVVGGLGRIGSSLYSCCSLKTGIFAPSLNVAVGDIFQIRNYAARKGTREKARKKKVKAEIKKIEFIPHNLRAKKAPVYTKRIDDNEKPVSPDNVWISRAYRWPVYNFADAIECHRESSHPTVINRPNNEIYANIELDMRAVKANRFLDPFTRVVSTPHPFINDGPRPVLAFCKTHELQRSALEAGATVAGDTDLIKSIQTGDLNVDDFKFVIAHPNIITELLPVRGLMKKKFPNPKYGTLGPNIAELVAKYSFGMEYTANVSVNLNDFGWIFAAFGKLDMETSHLEENFTTLIEDVNAMRPKREGPFITKCCLVSLPLSERLKINYSKYIGEEETSGDVQEEDDDETEEREESDDETNKNDKKKAASAV
ncbi:hypothetical protein L9F63_003762 [Diploptera punctata]|uniref:39S ribosomal protein L1, mitochondrial n=1 Tax=Diploptera punctata TaxID=6984 RepID=A0AAD7ZL70_DIPPU|nr:hypothetical protein L9F63_003762 [Diploptera punctata]